MNAWMLSAMLSGAAVIDLDGTLLVQLGIFLVSLLVLRSFVFKPLLRVFDAREEAIDGARKQAASLSDDAGNKEAEFQKEMHKAKLTAARERERLRNEGISLEKNLIEKVRTETLKTVASSKQKIEEEAAAVRAEVQTTVPGLAKTIVTKILEREA